MQHSDHRRLKALLTICDADIKAVKTMARNPTVLNPERFRCHLDHLVANVEEILALFSTAPEPDTRQDSLPFDLEPVFTQETN